MRQSEEGGTRLGWLCRVVPHWGEGICFMSLMAPVALWEGVTLSEAIPSSWGHFWVKDTAVSQLQPESSSWKVAMLVLKRASGLYYRGVLKTLHSVGTWKWIPEKLLTWMSQRVFIPSEGETLITRDQYGFMEMAGINWTSSRLMAGFSWNLCRYSDLGITNYTAVL